VLETREGTLGGEQTLADFAVEQSVALTRFAYLLGGDRQRAEDLVQNAFLALHRRFGGTLSLAAPVAYARKAIVNAHISQSRKRSATERVTGTVPDTPAPAADQLEQDAMWHALHGLPERGFAALRRLREFSKDVP
jgi:DNA-directed RNA polymerase specialized sigma24 family protein